MHSPVRWSHSQVPTNAPQLSRRFFAIVGYADQQAFQKHTTLPLFGGRHRIESLEVALRLFEPLVAHDIFDKTFNDKAFDDGNSGQ